MNHDWPFDQTENAAALTTRQVLEEGYPILHVVHYSDDHSWAFTCGTTDNIDDGRIVCMSHILAMDASIADVADLKPGYIAHRERTGGTWEYFQDDEM